LETGLGEVLIVSQGAFDALPLHDQEAGAVGKTPVLVGPLFVSAQRPFELIARLGYHGYVGAASQGLDCFRSRGAKVRSTVAKPVQEFNQDHLAGDNLIGRRAPARSDGSRMQFVGRIEKGNPLAGVREDAPHEVTFEVP